MRTRRWRRMRVTLRIIARKLLVDRDVCRSETKAIIVASFRSWAAVWTREQDGHKSALLMDGNTLCIWRILFAHVLERYSCTNLFNIFLILSSHLQLILLQWTCLDRRAKSHISFSLLGSFQRIRPRPGPCVTFRNMWFVCGEELLCPQTDLSKNLEYHPLSAVRDCSCKY
jgi:hypothetical protein